MRKYFTLMMIVVFFATTLSATPAKKVAYKTGLESGAKTLTVCEKTKILCVLGSNVWAFQNKGGKKEHVVGPYGSITAQQGSKDGFPFGEWGIREFMPSPEQATTDGGKMWFELRFNGTVKATTESNPITVINPDKKTACKDPDFWTDPGQDATFW
ncbi:hypothetical protein T439DRAFT_356509 [Meredithblackwellia eburnea MCA 4105]